VILIDANVFMYAAGKDHPHKEPSIAFLDRAARDEIEAAVDAEVLQEILHRYRAMGRWADGRNVFRLARRSVPLTLPITADVLDRAADLLDRHDSLSARDALHAAVALEADAEAICSFDHHFDSVPGLRRIQP